jgi:chromosome segregation ATPase
VGTIGLLLTVTGLIISMIKYIENNKIEAIKESEEYVNKKIEEHEMELKQYTQKIDEFNAWKSDINTKIEVFSIKLEHNTEILENQSETLKTLNTSSQSIAVSLAVLSEAFKTLNFK